MFLFSYSFRWILRSFGLIPKNKKVNIGSVLLPGCKRIKRSRSDPFFCLDAKEPKNQGLHSKGYKFAS